MFPGGDSFMMNAKGPRSLVSWLVIIILASSVCLVGGVWFYNWDAPRPDVGVARAQPLLAAIQTYQSQTGSFPPALVYLLPVYLSEIPRPDIRHEFCYDLREDGKSFTLAFVPKGEMIGDGWYVYSSNLDHWQGTDSDFLQPCQFNFDLYP